MPQVNFSVTYTEDESAEVDEFLLQFNSIVLEHGSSNCLLHLSPVLAEVRRRLLDPFGYVVREESLPLTGAASLSDSCQFDE